MLVNEEATNAQNGCVVDMRMLRWMCGKSRKDKIRNEGFREHLVVAMIGDKIRETCLRWFGNAQRRLAVAPVRKCLAMKVDGPRRGRVGQSGRGWR